MSSNTPVTSKLTLDRFWERLTRLHVSRNWDDLHRHLQQVLKECFEITQFTVIARQDSALQLMFTSYLSPFSNRLNPPVLRDEAMTQLQGALQNGDSGLLSIDGHDVPVAGLWEVGSGAGSEVYVCFQDAAEFERLSGSNREWVDPLRHHLVAIYQRISESMRIHREVDLLHGQVDAINGIGELLGSLDLEVLLTRLLELSLYIAKGQVGSIVLAPKPGTDEGYECPIEWGLPLEMAECLRTADEAPIYQSVVETGRPIAAPSFSEASGFRVVGADVFVESYLCVPLISKSRVLGAVNVVNCHWSEMDHEVLMTICGLAATSIENALLYQDSIEKERYQENLKIARDIQQRLYPASPPEVSWLDIAFKTEPCDETGGDYFDFFEAATDGSLTFVIGDVSGHGIGAALHMVAARSGLRTNLVQGRSLAESLESLGDQLEADMEIEHFMTMCVTKFDPDLQTITFVNAGHDAPCVFRGKTNAVEELGSTGIPLGLFPGQAYGLGELSGLEPGDVFLAMTDGVWEVNDPQGEMLGKERLEAIFKELCRTEQSADAIASGILRRVAEFTHGSPPRDDVTLVVARAC